MGIDTSAMLIVGLTRGEMEMTDEIEELIDEGELDSCPTYYDGGGDDCGVIGYAVTSTSDNSSEEVTDEDLGKIMALKSKFKAQTGQEAKLLVSPHVC
jgi:hypothetical protein